MCIDCGGTGYAMFVDDGGDVEVVRCYTCCAETDEPVTAPAALHTAVTRLVGELRDAGIPDPLGATMTLGAVLSDLYRVAGIEAPIGLDAWMGATR